VNQFSADGTTNIKTSPLITNIFNFNSLIVTGAFAGLEIDNGTAGQRWSIDPSVGALNYFGTDAYIGLVGAPFLVLAQNEGRFITNLIVSGTNLANWLKLGGGVPAGSLLRADSNTNVVAATIGSGITFDGTTISVPAVTFFTNWTDAISNLVNTKQFGSASLTNLSGNPNVVTQILAGANITVTSNNAGVFTITGSGGAGIPGGAQNSIQVNQPNGTFYGTNTATQVFAFDSTNGNMTIGNGSRTLDIFPNRWVMRELQDFNFGIFSQTNWRISSATPAGSLIPNSSNTVVIGNSTNPIATISIVSNILLRDLAGLGKVLTSDADGVGTWQTATSGGDAGGTNARQFGSATLTNLTDNPYKGYTNEVFGGTNISIRTVGGTNFIDTIGQLNNWSQIPTGTMANVVSTTFFTNWTDAISNLAQTKLQGVTNQYTTNVPGTPVIGSFWFGGTNGTIVTNAARVGVEWIPVMRTWRSGELGANEASPDPFDSTTPASNYWAGTNMGFGSFANGSNVMVQGHYSSILNGIWNIIRTNAIGSSIVGGSNNIIYTNSAFSFIGGGANNYIRMDSAYSTVVGGGGGAQNGIKGSDWSFVGGGQGNVIGDTSDNSSIVGGSVNTMTGASGSSFIGGGGPNAISGATFATIGGGQNHVIASGALGGFIGGGSANNLGTSASESSVVGGNDNNINTSIRSFIGGGSGNNIGNNSDYSLIVGGNANIISANSGFSQIIGGSSNLIQGILATVIGHTVSNLTERSIELGETNNNKVRIDRTNLWLIGDMRILMTNGAGSGKVLTSDADGQLTLQTGGSGDAGGTNSRQAGSLILTNASLTGVITNAPWTTNLSVGYNLAVAVSNLPNNSIVNILPGTHNVTPYIVGITGYAGLNLISKTNIVINAYGATINGHAAVGELFFATNCSGITINGGVWDGLVITNIAVLTPTNAQWALMRYAHCEKFSINYASVINAQYHGILDAGANAGETPSTNQIRFFRCYVYNCGSKTTNNPVNWDGAGIELTGGTVEQCYLEANHRGVEIYSEGGASQFYSTIIRDNYFINTLEADILTAGSTNGHGIQISGNLFDRERGFTRRGSNYLGGGVGVWLNGGHGHRIVNNRFRGTNLNAILVGGAYMHNIEVNDNFIDGWTGGVNIGANASGQGNHQNLICRGNTVLDSGAAFVFNSCRDGFITQNKAIDFTTAFAVGFDIYPTQPNTNMVISDNAVRDTSGNLYTSYFIRAGNNRIIMSNNDGTNGTQSFIENLAGTGLIYRSQRNNSGSTLFSEPLIFSAGSGTSNTIAGGLMFYDGARYTNHSTVGNFTNLAFMMVPEHTLTNLGDTITGTWRGTMRSPGTNTFVVGYGTETNIFATPTLANTRNTAYELVTMLTRTGNTTADAYMRWEISEGSSTVSQTNWMAIISPTHGVTNIFRLQAKGQGAGGMTNRFFSVEYQPAARL
jgi:hypothetical protein